MYRARIAGTGSYLPEKVLTNYDLEKMVETSNEWIVERTGIVERRLAAKNQATSDLAAPAAKSAIERAGISPKDIELILFATLTPDRPMPNTANVLQEKLKIGTCPAMDLSAACSGFVYVLSIANQYIKTGLYKNILIIGAETLSSIVNFDDRETCILFGDGAGAAVISRAEEDQDSLILSEHLHSDGTLGHLIEIPAGGSEMEITHEALDSKLNKVRMKGREIFKNAVRTLTQCCQEAIDQNNFKVEDIDWLIPHQANYRIIDAVAKYFKIPHERVIVNVNRTGNTSAGTIPIALDEAIQDGRIKRGQHLLLTAFGGGLTSGSVLLKY